MKRTYLAKRNALIGSARLSWGAYALLFALLLLFFRLAFPDAFAAAAAPVMRASSAVSGGTHAFFSRFGNAEALTLENEQLREEQAALAALNEALRQKLEAVEGLAPAAPEVIAGVLARPPVSPYDTLIISAGTEHGVSIGMAAYAPGGVPIGAVSEALAQFSRITLYSSPGIVVSGWVGSVPIEIRGKGGGSYQAAASRTAGIRAGDIVYAMGPGKLLLGSVARIDSDPTLSSVTLHITGAANLFSLSWIGLSGGGAIHAFATSTSL